MVVMAVVFSTICAVRLQHLLHGSGASIPLPGRADRAADACALHVQSREAWHKHRSAMGGDRMHGCLSSPAVHLEVLAGPLRQTRQGHSACTHPAGFCGRHVAPAPAVERQGGARDQHGACHRTAGSCQRSKASTPGGEETMLRTAARDGVALGRGTQWHSVGGIAIISLCCVTVGCHDADS